MKGKTEVEIDSVVLHWVRIPMHEPFRISNGEVREKESIIVEVHSKEATGFGEASPMPAAFYSKETPESTWNALKKDLIPDLFTRTLQSPVDYAKSLSGYPQEPFARAGIEGAIWHHEACRLSTTIAALIGGASAPIPSGVAIGIFNTKEELIERIRTFRELGYQRVKIKIQPGWDIEPLIAIRNTFGDDLPLMVDANGAYNYEEHYSLLQSLDQFNLMMIEQPFAAHEHALMGELQSNISTPICADESAESLHALEEVILHKAAKIINIKVQRVGGLWNAKRMLDLAVQAGLDCWLGTMPELGIATAQALSLATLRGFTYPTDIEASNRWYTDDIIEPKIAIDPQGFIHPPDDGPMSYRVSEEKIRQYTIMSETFNR